MKSTEEINQEIEQVKNEFGSTEEILGYTADQKNRCRLANREIRSFTWFVRFMIFSDLKLDDDERRFKEEYKEFKLDLEANTCDDVFKWACLYYIYNREWMDYYGY